MQCAERSPNHVLLKAPHVGPIVRELQGDQGKEHVRRAWVGVGAPILGLVVLVIALAIAAFAGFARHQDEAYVTNTQRLAQNAIAARAEALGAMMIEYANWDAAYQNISRTWNPEWVSENFYSSVVDSMLVFGADGAVRHHWFSANVANATELEEAVMAAIRATPNLALLARAPTVEQTIAHTFAQLNGQLVIIAIAPITQEDEAARMNQTRRLGLDFVAAVKVMSPADMAALAESLDLAGLRIGASHDAPGFISIPLQAADGEVVAALQWRRQYPGADAFMRHIIPVVLGLLGVGFLTVLLARHLVSRQIAAAAGARAALEASNEKSEFLRRVSQELHAPLDAVIGYAELVREEATQPAVREDAGHIISAARALSRMLNDIIDQSELDVGKLRLKFEVTPIAGLLADVQGLMHPLAKSANVRLMVSQDASALYAYADYARLRQCLMNLIGNAIKFSPRGGAVRVRACHVGAMIRIEIRDSGFGVPANDVTTIFRPFSQANIGASAAYGGLGLGLSIAQSLAREMGGDITVRSEPGEGSVFALDTPIAPAHVMGAA